MAARKLRYKWFKDLSSQEKFDYIVTAHHYDDIIETVLLIYLEQLVLVVLLG